MSRRCCGKARSTAQADTDMLGHTPLVKARREKLQNFTGVRQVSIVTRIEDRASAGIFQLPSPTDLGTAAAGAGDCRYTKSISIVLPPLRE